jgi:hypothetical protein
MRAFFCVPMKSSNPGLYTRIFSENSSDFFLTQKTNQYSIIIKA